MDDFPLKVGNCYLFTNEGKERRSDGTFDVVFKDVTKKRDSKDNTYQIFVRDESYPERNSKIEVTAMLEGITELPGKYVPERILHFRLDDTACNELLYELSDDDQRKIRDIATAARNVASAEEGATMDTVMTAAADADERAFYEAQDVTKKADLELGDVKKCTYSISWDDLWNTAYRFTIVKEIPCGRLAGGKRKTKKARRKNRRQRASKRA